MSLVQISVKINCSNLRSQKKNTPKKQTADSHATQMTTEVFIDNLCLTSTISSHNDQTVLHESLLNVGGSMAVRTQEKNCLRPKNVECITLTMLEHMHRKLNVVLHHNEKHLTMLIYFM